MTCTARCIFLLAGMLAAAPGRACYAPPAGQIIDVDRQIAEASDVALARVVRATPLGDDVVEYEFAVQRRLAGPARPVFALTGRAGAPGAQDTTFAQHTDPGFWRRGGGRTMNAGDCVIHPSFVVGASYLVFLGAPTWRSFERIAEPGGPMVKPDAWLAYVAARLHPAP